MVKPQRRISKKELKQDEFLEFLYKGEQFIRKNAKVLSYIGAGVVAVVVIAILMYNSRQNAEMAASAAVGAAQSAFDQGNYTEVIDQLEPVIETYAGTNSAGVAVFYMGSAYYRQGKYEQAGEYFQKYIDEYDTDPMLGATAHANLGALAAAEEKYSEASEHFREAMRRAPYKFMMHRFSLDAAKYTFRAGETEKARTLLTNLISTDDLKSEVKSEAEELLETIEVEQTTN